MDFRSDNVASVAPEIMAAIAAANAGPAATMPAIAFRLCWRR